MRNVIKTLFLLAIVGLGTGCATSGTWFPGVSEQELLEREMISDHLNQPVANTVPIWKYRF
jgi:hypothetical protein